MPVTKTEHTPRSVDSVWPIFVPSKGRPDTSTCKLLKEVGLNYRLVIERPEYHDYRKAQEHECYIFLPHNDQGVSFVRNHIKEMATTARFRWFWMLDDDLKGTFLVRDGKTVKAPINEVLLEAQKVFLRSSLVALGALEYQQFAWSAKKDSAIGYCDVAVCMNTTKTFDLAYRPATKEDRDFALQVLAKGFLSMRATHCAFAAPKIGSNPGGLHDDYQKNRDRDWAEQMVKDWPGVCELVEKGDRIDAKINWKMFRPK